MFNACCDGFLELNTGQYKNSGSSFGAVTVRFDLGKIFSVTNVVSFLSMISSANGGCMSNAGESVFPGCRAGEETILDEYVVVNE